jgi:23S rRNA (guanosine2251-2'-O)-methyltransferase
MKPIQVEGRNPVLEMLRRGIAITELFIDSHARLYKKLEEILALARKNKAKIKQVGRSTLDKMSATGVHMGLIAYATAPPLPQKLKDLVKECYSKNQEPFLLVFNQVVFQQNLGAIARTANAAGVHGIILPKKQENPLSPEVIRVSMGAAFFTPIIRENIFNAFKIFKSEGISIIGVDMKGETLYSNAHLGGSVALVLGGEHKGLSEPERKKCDQIVRIPMKGMVSSLNVSVACPRRGEPNMLRKFVGVGSHSSPGDGAVS